MLLHPGMVVETAESAIVATPTVLMLTIYWLEIAAEGHPQYEFAGGHDGFVFRT